MNFLLVEPEFPLPTKSKNHKDFLPAGLLKLAALLENKGNKVQLVRGNEKKDKIIFRPKEIWITSLFTYWIDDVRKSVEHYRRLFKNVKITVGGIAASLLGEEETKKITKCDEVYIGVNEEAEKLSSDLLKKAYKKHLNGEVDFQILHAQRGCIRRCKFCGTYLIEPRFIPVKSIKSKIFMRKLVFYDNNFLANPHIETILDELIELKNQRKILWCESQSGFDGRLMLKNTHLVKKIKEAGFRDVRIAWDGSFNEAEKIKKQIDLLKKTGYKSKDLYVFMIYNWDISFEDMEKKRVQCFKWKVQISDCRNRPLTQKFDNYKPNKNKQTNDDYYIHEEKGWSDKLVKQFRRNVRRQNICVRHGFYVYSKDLERKKASREVSLEIQHSKTKREAVGLLKKYNLSNWDPSKQPSIDS